MDYDLIEADVVITADTGFASEDNMRHLHDGGYNAYKRDNQFRSRDPKFQDRLKPPSRQRERKHRKTFIAGENGA